MFALNNLSWMQGRSRKWWNKSKLILETSSPRKPWTRSVSSSIFWSADLVSIWIDYTNSAFGKSIHNCCYFIHLLPAHIVNILGWTVIRWQDLEQNAYTTPQFLFWSTWLKLTNPKLKLAIFIASAIMLQPCRAGRDWYYCHSLATPPWLHL